MRRRELLASSVVATLGLAGCQSSGNGTTLDDDTQAPTDTESETTPAGGTPTTDSTDQTLPRLETDDNWIVTADGEQFTPRGVNLVEPLFADRNAAKRGANYEESLRLATDVDEGWHTRIVRVPVTQWGIDELGMDKYASRFLDPTIEHCREQNVYVILDFHIIKDWNKSAVAEQVETFWSFFAPRYADEPHVLYEFFNEPQNPAEDTLENWNAWKETAQPWVDMIREHAPDTPIIVGSPGWTSLTKFAAENPFEGENLIYAGHIYPGDGKSAEVLDPDYGEPAEEVPVMITEWGYSGISQTQPGTTSNFGEPFREWLESRENIGWTAWCFDSHWGPVMFDFDFNLTGGELHHGHFVKKWLYEARDKHVPAPINTEGAAYEGPTDDTAPPAPANPELTVADGTVSIAWDKSVDTDTRVMHYNIYVNDSLRKHVPSVALLNEADAENAFQAEDLRFERTLDGFSPGKTYDVTVTAVDALSNESEPSSTVTYEPEGELKIHATLPKTESAPSIDGVAGEAWSGAGLHEFQHVPTGTIDSDRDLDGGWRAMWDSAALYVLVEITDDEKVTGDSDALWKDDSVELFIDGDNSKLGSYDGVNDFQIKLPRGNSMPETAGPIDPAAIEYTVTDTDEGWQIEVALPWSSIAPDQPIEPGSVIGFDCHVNDDDSGGGRDGKVTWIDSTDTAWKDPSVFGNVKLGQ